MLDGDGRVTEACVRDRFLVYVTGMPYSANTELPENVRAKLPEAAQSVFRSAFNSALSSKGDEAIAFRSAWGAVTNAGFEQGDDGKWAKKARQNPLRGERKPSEPREPRSEDPDMFGSPDEYPGGRSAYQRARQEWDRFHDRYAHWMEWGKASKSELDAPNLRVVDRDDTRRCGTCVYYDARGWCSRFEFEATQDQTCDAYEERASLAGSGQAYRPDQTVQRRYTVKVAKQDSDQQLVFGWLYVARDHHGRTVVDHSGETIAPAELEKAAYEFVLKFRVAGQMHEKIGVGRLVECVAFTQEKRQAMGIPEGVVPDGVWVGFKIDDAETWAKVKSGELGMLSLGGKAVRRRVEGLDAAA